MKIGDKVVLSKKGRQSFRLYRGLSGTVVGLYEDKHLIRVQRDGIKKPERWHVSFWRKS